MAAKTRLDQLLVTRGLVESRNKAQALIMAGEVRVNGQVQLRAALPVADDADITVAEALPYVSRGGYKLAHALDTFSLDPTGLVALDAGASTGGFTDVLLQRGAVRVFAVDVGYGILHWKIRQDPRVVVLERTNIRYLAALPSADDRRRTTDDGQESPTIDQASSIRNQESGIRNQESNITHQASSIRLPDCAVIDVSFIPLELVLPAVQRLIVPGGWIVALIKPQFEAGVEHVGKGGVVRDPSVHRSVLRRVLKAAADLRLPPQGIARSPITGPAGNVEFLAWLQAGDATLDVERAVRNVVGET